VQEEGVQSRQFFLRQEMILNISMRLSLCQNFSFRCALREEQAPVYPGPGRLSPEAEPVPDKGPPLSRPFQVQGQGVNLLALACLKDEPIPQTVPGPGQARQFLLVHRRRRLNGKGAAASLKDFRPRNPTTGTGLRPPLTCRLPTQIFSKFSPGK